MTFDASVAAFRELFPPTRADSDRPPLEVGNLRVQFGGLAALKDVSFTMASHETMSIIGQNGAGKSTLLNAISGLVASTADSRISVRGRALNGVAAWRRARSGLGRAFQDPPLVDEMTARENLLLGAHSLLAGSQIDRFIRPRRVRREEDEIRARADVLLDLVGLTSRAEQNAGSLPYGARKLLDVARGLMSQPDVLLLDEPTSGLDSSEQQVVEGILQLIHASERLSILMVEHHMELVRSVSDRVLVLNAGSVELIATPDEALGHPAATGAPSAAATPSASAAGPTDRPTLDSAGRNDS
ncbi:ABC transporter ATP-binding protein [soil metagenome]